MELFSNLGIGLASALQVTNLLYCFIGVTLGTVIGVLPGIGPLATIAMLLPITYGLPPTTALIVLAGIYYGSQYGGSTTAILLNLPGESASAVTTIDGYQMAKKGRAGPALAAAGLSSFFAGSVSTLLIAIVALPLTAIAMQFGSPEYFSLLVVGLISSITLASGSVLKALAMIVLGLIVSMAGADIYTGMPRFTFGMPQMLDGLDFVAVAVGLFGVGEILRNLESNVSGRAVTLFEVGKLMPSKDDLKRIIMPSIRGTMVGSFLGILPGGGAILSSFVAYNLEKQVSRNSSEFGQGAIEGVAAPEAANNAGAQTSFIPMLSLGIPSNVIMAMMMGAMIMQGISPGPNVVTEYPDLFWGLIVSMWIGNAMLIVLNLPLIGIWTSLLRIPYGVLFPAIVCFCCIGVFSVNNSTFGLFIVIIFGLIGYFLVKLQCELAPFVLGFVLGPMLEEHLRRALLLSEGDYSVFVMQPISAALLVVAAILLIVVSLPAITRKRQEVFVDED